LDFLSDFESEHFVYEFAKNRLAGKTPQKNARYLQKVKMNNKRVDIFKPLRTTKIKTIMSDVTNNSRQAQDFYKKSKELPLLSKPILLHYAFEKLANILVLLTYGKVELKYTHGLSYYGLQEPIIVHGKGLFQCFHDCYSLDPSIYSKESQFSFESLIDAGKIDYLQLDYCMSHGSINARVINLKTRNQIIMEELDREFIFIFFFRRCQDIELTNGIK
jgi:hypothetical protein